MVLDGAVSSLLQNCPTSRKVNKSNSKQEHLAHSKENIFIIYSYGKSPLVTGFLTVIGLTWLGHGSNISSCICVDLDLKDQLRL